MVCFYGHLLVTFVFFSPSVSFADSSLVIGSLGHSRATATIQQRDKSQFLNFYRRANCILQFDSFRSIMLLTILERQGQGMQHEQTPITRQTPRRRKRTKMQIFKEAYLPTIILAVTIVLILVFIIGGAIQRNSSSETMPPETTVPTQVPSTDNHDEELLKEEAANLILRAEMLAGAYDYEGAIAALDSFSGDESLFPALGEARDRYNAIISSMVAWKASDVPNLSFHVLIADPNRAFSDKTYASSYKKNFVTVSEFSAILQQLYDNGYVLVDLDDFYTTQHNSSTGRDVYVEKELLLPVGKKPVMLTETNANYYTYMIDPNEDGKPDAKSSGFASKLCYDGSFYNELVNADGSISTGAYDLVPILEEFLEYNPDFSYKGARATISFSGYDGVLGYRINSKKLSAQRLQEEREGAAAIVQALKDAGYKLACYTYDNINYSTKDANSIKKDLDKWAEEITPWIGQLDILVFARNADIGDESPYSGSKFNVLYNAGFRYFMATYDTPWNQVNELYVRHNRLAVTGTNLQKHPDMFAGMFDADTLLDPSRP